MVAQTASLRYGLELTAGSNRIPADVLLANDVVWTQVGGVFQWDYNFHCGTGARLYWSCTRNPAPFKTA